MKNVSDYLVFNDVPYSKFSGEIKGKLDSFINNLEKAGLTKQILELEPTNKIIIDHKRSETFFITGTGKVPPDLLKRITDVFIQNPF